MHTQDVSQFWPEILKIPSRARFSCQFLVGVLEWRSYPKPPVPQVHTTSSAISGDFDSDSDGFGY
jgi:hypothetical protein